MVHEVRARNFAAEHENQIHSDEIAARYGFRGALVPGVAVWGHMTHPLVREHGVDWLASGHSAVRFLTPAYDDDLLRVERHRGADGERVVCTNENGERLAKLSSPPAGEPLLDAVRRDRFPSRFVAAPEKPPERVEIGWETVREGERFAPWSFELTAEENRRWTHEVDDSLAVYRERVIHPHWILGLANRALTREYVMPAWIHVGSEVRFHELLREADAVELQTLVDAKWERKGHQFLRTHTRLERAGQLTTEIAHTAIFRIAP